MRSPYFLFLTFVVLQLNLILAQNKTIDFISKDTVSRHFFLENIHSLDSLETILNNEGYYFYNLKSIKKDSIDTFLVELGEKTSVIGVGKIPEEIQEIFKTKKETFYINQQDIPYWIQKINNDFDERGKSFNEVKFINHQLKNDTLFCDLQIKNSATRKISKTVIRGYPKFPKRFLKHYISTKKPFSKELLNTTENKINQLSFVKNTKSPAVLFTNDSTHLYLYMDKVKANKLDALLGFGNSESDNKIRFNGYIDLSLTNTLNKGETLAFKWNNTGDDQQEVDLTIDNPYIFNSPINMGYHLNIFRRDSTFVNTQNQFIIGYKPHYKHLINAYYNTELSSTLSNTDDNITEYTKNSFGLQYNYKSLNQFGMPKIKIDFDIGIGNKNTETEQTQQGVFMSDLIYTIEINPINQIFIENRNAYLKSENKNTNEFYRTGGATTIRGFLEQSVVAYLYNYTNIEYRYFTNNISYLYGFSDVGYFKDLTQENNLLSLGLGYTMGVPSGLLKISYAVGKNQDTEFNVNNGLFHINFVTIF